MNKIRRDLGRKGNLPHNDFIDRVKQSLLDNMSEDCRAMYAAGVEFQYGVERRADGSMHMTMWTTYLCAVHRDADGNVIQIVESDQRAPQPEGLMAHDPGDDDARRTKEAIALLEGKGYHVMDALQEPKET